MKSIELDLIECLKDSPKFRSALEEHESSIGELESHLEKLTKISSQMVDAGKNYSLTMSSLMNCFANLALFFSSDDFVSSALKKLNGVLSDLQTFFSVFLEQTQKSISYSISRFVKEDIKKLKETKKIYDKISDDLDSARIRNSQLLKTCKPSDAEDAINVLTATQSCFNHTALDYAFLVNSLQAKRRFRILRQIVLYVNGHFTYHKHGNDIYAKFQDFSEILNKELEAIESAYDTKHKEMDERHNLVHDKNQEYDSIAQFPMKSKNNVIMDGYLFKKSSNAFKMWNRRWFVIQNNKLYYTRRSKSEPITEMVDLRLSTVKRAEDCDRRFTFAVVCPTKCWYLQADNDKLKDRWITVMQMAIAKALNDPDGMEDLAKTSLTKLHPQYLLERISQIPGNNACVDCNGPNPKWASINLGAVLCIECSGIHRSLGVHVSKVRSITLDAWDPETIKLMLDLGNDVVNNIYEANVCFPFTKPTCESSRGERETWIQAKYVKKTFVSHVMMPRPKPLKRSKIPKRGKNGRLRSYSLEKLDAIDKEETFYTGGRGSPAVHNVLTTAKSVHELSDSTDDDLEHSVNSLHPNVLLYRCSKDKDLSMMLLALANGADVNWRNSELCQRTALHETVITGSVSASEYLIQNGASVNLADANGRAPLHHAALHGSTGHACLFLKRDANQSAVDKHGQDALTIALKNTHADIVTLLRLARLHEEIKETDISMGGDETVTNVFRDFSNMASNNPEKLKRGKQTNV